MSKPYFVWVQPSKGRRWRMIGTAPTYAEGVWMAAGLGNFWVTRSDEKPGKRRKPK